MGDRDHFCPRHGGGSSVRGANVIEGLPCDCPAQEKIRVIRFYEIYWTDRNNIQHQLHAVHAARVLQFMEQLRNDTGVDSESVTIWMTNEEEVDHAKLKELEAQGF